MLRGLAALVNGADASRARGGAWQQRTELEEEYEKLEAIFGTGLAGLSGLVLAEAERE